MPMDIAKLGRADLLLLLEFVEQTMVVRDGMEVSAMLRRLCQHVPARGVIAVASVSRMFDLRKTADAPRPKFPAGTEGQVVNTGGLSFLNIGYPEPWLAEYWSKNYFVS